MRLIKVESYELEDFLDDQAPPYAILSHTWGPDSEELTFRDVEDGKVDKPGVGAIKIRGCCQQAWRDRLGYAWIDTCCIDKTNHVELSEAINSMFRWYAAAALCYVYMSDVPADDNPREPGSKFQSSRWFRRGWTLQEMLAPKAVRFYSSDWQNLGTKGSLCSAIKQVTGVPHQFLLHIADLLDASVAQRMSWAANRDTKRKEDLAYCLLGLFGVTMPMIYGEGGEQAFLRLQEQIMKKTRDDSILAWDPMPANARQDVDTEVSVGGTTRVLAASPFEFANAGQIVSRRQFSAPMTSSLELSGGTLRAHLPLVNKANGEIWALLNSVHESDAKSQLAIGIPLAEAATGSTGVYVRLNKPAVVLKIAELETLPEPQLIHISNDNRSGAETAVSNRQHLLYDAFAEEQLDLVDVFPPSCWDKDQAYVVWTLNATEDDRRPALLRFRQRNALNKDFVIAFRFNERGLGVVPEYFVMTCSRATPLSSLDSHLRYMTQKAQTVRSGSSWNLHLRVLMEPLGPSLHMIRPERLSAQPDDMTDADAVLKQVEAALQLASRLDIRYLSSVEDKNLKLKVKEKRGRLEQIQREQRKVEQEIAKLKLRRLNLLEEETLESGEIQDLNRMRAELARDINLEATPTWQRLWDILWCTDGTSNRLNGSAGTMNDEELLQFAATNGYGELALALLVGTSDGKSDDRSSNDEYQAISRFILSKNSLDAPDPNSGSTPLLDATKNGYRRMVRLLLAMGANPQESDDTGDTPLWWAETHGDEVIVELLEKAITKEIGGSFP